MSNIKKPAFNADAAEEYFSDLLVYYRNTANDIFRRDNEGRHASEHIYSAEYQKYVGMQIAMREVLEYFSKYDLEDVQDILGDNYDLDRLRELVESDRDGRCVVLPFSAFEVKDSNMVWIIEPYEDDEPEVAGYVLLGMNGQYAFLSPQINGEKDPHELCAELFSSFYDYDEAECVVVWPIDQCYPTKEAAEAALKGEQDG